MKVLVLGAEGMMGHMAVRVLGGRHDVVGTTRAVADPRRPLGRFLHGDQWLGGLDVLDQVAIRRAIEAQQPQVVLNCVGVVKQLSSSKVHVPAIEINSLLPHRLAELCVPRNIRLIHLSTDCVFSGSRGMYTEADHPDAEDLYGRSKLLGELHATEGLTLRTSIVGRQLSPGASLLEWFLAARGKSVPGYCHAVFSGLTTKALATVIDHLITDEPELTGLWHVASVPINKYDLLCEVDKLLRLGITVRADNEFHCDRSLDGSNFRRRTGLVTPTWHQMIADFAADQGSYEFSD